MSNVLEAIRAKREELAKEKSITLDVPGYGGHLAIRYKAIPTEQLNRFLTQAAASGNDEKILEVNADILIRCCEAILVRQDPDAELEPLDPDAAEPTTFSTGTLPELLELSASSAREEVFAVFSPDGAQPLSIGRHADAIANWLQGSTEAIDKSLLHF